MSAASNRKKQGIVQETGGGIEDRGEGNLAVLGGFLILAQIWVFSLLGWLVRLWAGAIQPTPPTVLVVGGNGFIGAATTNFLIHQGYHVVMANRNSSYFDNHRRLSKAKHIYWDRRLETLDEAPEVQQFLAQKPKILAVIDFSCYDGVQAAQILDYIRPLQVTYYIYISTDSVYEVTTKDHVGPTLETDDQRPVDPVLKAQLNSLDPYGDKKLEAEETITNLWYNDSMSYAFVRIPDVIGPRDTTYRFWMYQILIKLQSRIDVPIPLVQEDEDGREMSVVYVDDVAKAVKWLISPEYNRDKIVNAPINIAQTETFTFKEIMADIAGELKIDGANLKYDLNTTTDFPSVKKGPISTALAESPEKMKWDSTAWPDVISETVRYNEKAMTDPTLTKEIQAVLTMVYQQVAKYDQVDALIQALNDVYGLNATSMIAAIEAGTKQGTAPIQEDSPEEEEATPEVRHEL